MICRQCQRLLSPYLDSVLAADERNVILAHLAQCPACTERLQQLETNRQLLRTLPTAEVSKAMELLLQSSLQKSGARIRSSQSAIRNPQSAIRSWWRGWGMLSAGTLATCAASFLFYFSILQTPPPVSAEEVVTSMDELITTLDSDDEMRVIGEETEEEVDPDWQKDLNQWPISDDIE